jgi:hypothetical protein
MTKRQLPTRYPHDEHRVRTVRTRTSRTSAPIPLPPVAQGSAAQKDGGTIDGQD